MARIQQNEIKALVVPENILTIKSILQEFFSTVEEFHYNCLRKRNNRGMVYGPSEPVELEFCIRLNDPEDAKPYYEQLVSNEHFTFSFVFDATFNDNKVLTEYRDGMICDGYVVGIEEQYNNSQTAIVNATKKMVASDEQIQLKIRLLLVSNTYIGREKNLQSIFIHQS